MNILIGLFKTFLRVIYFIQKFNSPKRRVTIISRQSDSPSYDIQAIEKRIRKEIPDVHVHVMCKTLGGGIKNKLSYGVYMVCQLMPSFPSSAVVILDGYCIPASILKHKKTTHIVQMWHAMGCFKKFGRSILDKEEGSSEKLANAMDMHKGYDAFFASSERGVKAFAEAFGYPEDKGVVMPLPRYDYLTDKAAREEQSKKIIWLHPELYGKKNILYAPTFRKDEDGSRGLEDLLKAVDEKEYNIIYSPHPLTKVKEEHRKYLYHDFTAMELFSLSDAVISDYSALIFESAVAGIPTYLFTYDYDSYYEKRSFYIDMDKDIPLPRYGDAGRIMEAIEKGECTEEMLSSFAEAFVDKTEDATGNIVKYIADML